jgi:CheY-like chemotaxis protein
MGGTIDFISEPGHGTTFRLNLTLERPVETSRPVAARVAPVDPAAVNQGRSLKILIAEDNVINQLVAKGLIERLGHEVTVVGNGQEAIAVVAQEKFDLILMDVQMPVLDGYSATKEIRRMETELGKRTPVVALTAYAMQEERENCISAGMDDFLSKPIAPAALRQMLERYAQTEDFTK